MWNGQRISFTANNGLVVEGNGPSLFRRDWFSHILLDWQEAHKFHCSTLEEVLTRHESVPRRSGHLHRSQG